MSGLDADWTELVAVVGYLIGSRLPVDRRGCDRHPPAAWGQTLWDGKGYCPLCISGTRF